ncbi:MAG TPA: hypothetical protein VGF60_23520 [Xanthobacteraceae bacterium]|jgi:hypothetical protein
MGALVHTVITWLSAVVARLRARPAFVCGECERWQRCGLPPDKRCVVMAAQIARDGEPVARRPALPVC